MQALTPLLFSMLFPRFSTKTTTDRDPNFEGDYSHESLLSFQDGHAVYEQRHSQELAPVKTRRHRSTGADGIRRSASDPTPNSSLNRSNTFPPSRRTGRPKRLSLDHAAFMATYPMLDGLGDTSNRQTSNAFASRSSTVRKQRSQDTMSASRPSISSISSMVSDASSSSSLSSASPVQEPLTPTTNSPNYRKSLKMDQSGKSSAKDLINLHSFDESMGQVCVSPQSNNFFEEAGLHHHQQHQSNVVPGSITGHKAVVGARGQRQLIAH
ncbi:hypothetical protein BGZ54_002615 [Gamsiella multidivaricata]|nr:hypothetical protein BGZ54_002615 [Gamsiella multidivaricata]